MKSRALCFSIVILILTNIGFAQDIPSSPRSREVYERVAPRLTREMSDSGLVFGAPVFLRTFKWPSELEVWVKSGDKYSLFRSYPILFWGIGTYGPKTRQGDMQAVEGFYRILPSQLNPVSKYHLSINVGYPNKYDVASGYTGSAMMIHGGERSNGCFAMSDAGVEEIYTLVEAAFRKGQNQIEMHCFPFPLTDKNLENFSDSPWIAFWTTLRKGYEFFEAHHIPPAVTVQDGKYRISM